MSDLYISQLIKNGKEFDEIIKKIDNYDMSVIGIIKHSSSEDDLIDPLSSADILSNEKSVIILENYKNIPLDISEKFIMIQQAEMILGDDADFQKYVILSTPVGNIYAVKKGTTDFIDLKYATGTNTKTIPIVRGELTPEMLNKMSAYTHIITIHTDGNGYIYDRGKNKSISFRFKNEMYNSIYNPNNKSDSPYNYVESELDKIIGEYNTFKEHKKNALDNLHITAEERIRFNILLTVDKLAKLLKANKDEISTYIADKIEESTGLVSSTNKVQELNNRATAHINSESHLTQDEWGKYESKAEASHTHPVDQYRITGSDIVSGAIPIENLPNEIFDKVTKLDDISDLASVSEEDINNLFHTGCTVYVEKPDGDVWYRIIDSSKLNTPDYMQGIKEYKGNDISSIDFNAIKNKPTTVKGYKLANEVLDNESFNEKWTTNEFDDKVYNRNLKFPILTFPSLTTTDGLSIEVEDTDIKKADILSNRVLVVETFDSSNGRVLLEFFIYNTTLEKRIMKYIELYPFNICNITKFHDSTGLLLATDDITNMRLDEIITKFNDVDNISSIIEQFIPIIRDTSRTEHKNTNNIQHSVKTRIRTLYYDTEHDFLTTSTAFNSISDKELQMPFEAMYTIGEEVKLFEGNYFLSINDNDSLVLNHQYKIRETETIESSSPETTYFQILKSIVEGSNTVSESVDIINFAKKFE